MAKGPIETLRAIMAAAADDDPGKVDAEMHDFYVADNLATWKAKKTLTGSGQCAVMPQTASGAGKAAFWVQGPKVRGNKAIPPGTVIATFNEKGRYANDKHGNHAALLLEETSTGLRVLDQWADRDVSKGYERVLRWGNGYVNNGDNFSVVLTKKAINLLFLPGKGEYVAMG